jgi:hypothetical protein
MRGARLTREILPYYAFQCLNDFTLSEKKLQAIAMMSNAVKIHAEKKHEIEALF